MVTSKPSYLSRVTEITVVLYENTWEVWTMVTAKDGLGEELEGVRIYGSQ